MIILAFSPDLEQHSVIVGVSILVDDQFTEWHVHLFIHLSLTGFDSCPGSLLVLGLRCTKYRDGPAAKTF